MTRPSIVLAIGLMASTVAFAETPDQLARAHYLAAQAHFSQAAWGDALREFSESYRLAAYPVQLFFMARCHEELGHVREALDLFQRFVAADQTSGRRADALERIERLNRLPAPPAPSLAVASSPAPAKTTPRKRRWPVWVGVSAGVLAVGVAATVAGVLAGAPRDPSPTLGAVTWR